MKSNAMPPKSLNGNESFNGQFVSFSKASEKNYGFCKSGYDNSIKSWKFISLTILKGATMKISLPVAIVVGSLITITNHFSELFTGRLSLILSIRIILNYLIPYIVAGIGYARARVPR